MWTHAYQSADLSTTCHQNTVPSREKFPKKSHCIQEPTAPPKHIQNALNFFVDIEKNVSHKEVAARLKLKLDKEAGSHLEKTYVNSIYNKVKSAYKNQMK